MILPHHSRLNDTYECNKEEINDDDDGRVEGGAGGRNHIRLGLWFCIMVDGLWFRGRV